MNMLTNATPPDKTMSSIDLLKMINDARVQHGESAIRTNDFHARVADELEGDNYENFVVQNSNKTKTNAFWLNQDQCTLVAMRESKGVRRNVLDQLKRLQAQNQPTAIDLSNPEHLRNALLGYTEKVIALEHKVEELTPKAAALDRIADAAGLFGVREAAKVLGIKQNALVAFLLDRKWAYRDERNTLQGYATKLNAGYIEHIFSPPIMTSEGEKVFNTMRLTTKGVSRIGEILAQGAAA